MIAIGRFRSSSLTTLVYDDDGGSTWTADHGNHVYGVAIDADGKVYTGGTLTSSLTTRKYDEDGGLLWSRNHGAQVNAIAVDGSGNVYTGGNRTSSVTTRKYTSAGAAVTTGWPKDHGGIVWAIAVDGSGNVYTGGDRVSSVTTRKYQSDGTEVTTGGWPLDHGATVYGITVDASGNVYTVGVRSSDITTRKYQSDGTEITSGSWPLDHGAQVNGVAVDGAGNVYTGGLRTGNLTTRKYNSAGGLQWSVDHGDRVNGVAVDGAGNVYTVGALTSTVVLRKYQSDGTQITAAPWPLGGSTSYTIAWRGLALTTAVPALPLPLALGTPFITRFDAVPALALPLALGVPETIGPPAAPDVLARSVARLYRGLLTAPGGSTVYPLAVRAIECRRAVNESTWLNVRVDYRAALHALLPDALGGELLVEAGYRAADGSETFGSFLRATLTDYAYERGPQAGEIRLTGRVINPPFVATPRALSGVRDLISTDGRRTVVAAVDPLLRPNDPVTWGAESFVAGIIQYQITPADEWMRVTEKL